MADNYLDKKMEEYLLKPANTKRKSAVKLSQLILRNRSCRGYDKLFIVREDQLLSIIDAARLSASARNQQVLRFKPITGDGAQQMLPLIKMGAALPHLNLPTPGTEPNAYIIICSTIPENREVLIDLGIAAQSMLLRAVEMGLNGLCIAAFNPDRVREEFKLELQPLLIIAIGKGCEKYEIREIRENESHKYYREGDIHYVPKLSLEEIIIK